MEVQEEDNCIKKLTLSGSFNHRLDLFPSSLTQFNHPINCLPPSLLHLKFGHSFNSSPNPLPNGLRTLTFGDSFNRPLDCLPLELTDLTFDSNYLEGACESQNVLFLFIRINK